MNADKAWRLAMATAEESVQAVRASERHSSRIGRAVRYVARNAVQLTAALALGIAIGLVHQSQGAPLQPRIEEDSAQWDCSTMGNRQCGNQTGEVSGND